MNPINSSDTASDPPLDPHLDPRVHPYRDDIAADFLEGRIEAKTFVSGKPCRLGAPYAPVMSKPVISRSGPGELQASELLFGEGFTVYEDTAGWSWGQCGHDGYVGYVRSKDLFGNMPEPTHWVSAVRSLVYPDSLLLIICFGGNSPPFAVGRFDYGLPIRGIFAFGKCDCVANFDVHMHLLIRR